MISGKSGVALGRILRDLLDEDDPDALVETRVAPQERTAVDGRFDLTKVAHQFASIVRESWTEQGFQVDKTTE